MSVEIRVANTQIVFNPRSGESPIGQSPGAAIFAAIHHIAPDMPVYTFDAVLTDPARLDRPNTIVIGGDGSAAETAKHVPGVIFPLDGSTSGVIQKSLGFKRHRLEDPSVYTRRVMGKLMAGTYEIQPIAWGQVHRAHPYEAVEMPFVFRTGIGVPTYRYLEAMESLRGKLPNRLRVFAGLVHTLAATIHAPIFTVTCNSNAHAVLDAQVYKTPFLTSRMILTADSTRDVLITMNAMPLSHRLPHLSLDAFMIMILRKQPRFGGISLVPLSPDTRVYVQTPRNIPQTLQVDGEKRAGTPTRIIGSQRSGLVYQFADIRA